MPNPIAASSAPHRVLPFALLALSLPIALGACATPRPAAETSNVASAAQTAAEPAAPAQPSPMPKPPACDAQAAQSAIGKSADTATVEQARAAAGGHTVRVLKPGQAITKEYLDGRVNVYVDEKNTILEVNCG